MFLTARVRKTFRAALCCFALAGSPAFAQSSSGFPPNPSGAPPAGLPIGACMGSTDGKIDFRGHLTPAVLGSTVQIFSWSDGAQAYVDNLAAQLGPKSASAAQSPTPTIADLQAATTRAMQVPAAMAAASTASFVRGDFSCSGFAPGRYLFLAVVQGGPAQPGVPKSAITYYRADVDVSTVRRRATVVVNGFRRIASYPPQP